MKRSLVRDIEKNEGEEVRLLGRALNIRKLGEINFIQLQDYTGTIQCVFEKGVEAKTGEAVEISGIVKKEERSKGGYEIQANKIEVISGNTEELPIDLSKPELKLQLDTLLNLRVLSLRHPKTQAIFKLYDILLESYEMVMRKVGFTETKTPKLLGAASEGGANFFKVDYFEKSAYLAQSPQFYKQIMVGVFERVFEIGTVFRAEPHFTTRHVNEYISLDAEMGFIENFQDVATTLNRVVGEMFAMIDEKGKKYLEELGVEMPDVPDNIPHIKLAEIKKIIKEKYNYEIPQGTDIDPEGERIACRWAKEEHGSDFVFLTHYPWSDRPFYTMRDEKNPQETCGFDLLFRGVEIATGGQRTHDYKTLVENMKDKGIKPNGMEAYLDTFKYAMPPHGGWGMGSERLIQLILGLKSVKEATLFPRDVKRLSP